MIMWKQIRALLPAPKPDQLNISSHGQEACGLPFEEIQGVMKWLGLSLISAGYKANAHIIWDSPENPIDLSSVLKKGLKREEPIFLHRCSDSLSETLHERPTPPPPGYYWRLMPEYLTLRMYQLERRDV